MATATAERPKTATPDQNPAPAPTSVPPVKTEPAMMHVLDTTAIDGLRVHSISVNGTVLDFEFRPREAKKLPAAVAVKFLAVGDTFRLCNADGEIQAWSAVPKQPHQLEAGERFQLAEGTTIARFDELHSNAIKIRALQLPGGEKFAESRDRDVMIAFIMAEAEERRLKNIGREQLIGGATDLEEFTPAAEPDGTFFDAI